MQGVVFIFSPRAKLFVWNIIEIPENPVRKVITGRSVVFGSPEEERIFIPDVISNIPAIIPSRNGVAVTNEGRSVLITANKEAKNIIVAVTLRTPVELSAMDDGIASKREIFFFSFAPTEEEQGNFLKISPIMILPAICEKYIIRPSVTEPRNPAPTAAITKAGPALFVKQASRIASFFEIRSSLKRSKAVLAPTG